MAMAMGWVLIGVTGAEEGDEEMVSVAAAAAVEDKDVDEGVDAFFVAGVVLGGFDEGDGVDDGAGLEAGDPAPCLFGRLVAEGEEDMRVCVFFLLQ